MSLTAISGKKAKSVSISLAVNLCRYAFLISFSFVLLYPFIYILINSFKGALDYYDPTVQWVPKSFQLEDFIVYIKVTNFWKSMLNTFVYEIAAALIQFCSCAVAAYGIARFNFRGKRILMAAMILNILVPAMMIITPSYVNFSHMDFLGILKLISRLIGHDIRPNLIDTPLVFYLPSMLGVGLKGGLFIYIFSQFYKGLPRELEEAASIDGAGPWKTFLKIVLPSSGSAAITVLLFSIVWHWNDYYLAQMYNSKNTTLAVALNNISLNSIANAINSGMEAAKSSVVSIVLAGCLLFIIPLLIVYVVIQKKFIASIATSGIVG